MFIVVTRCFFEPDARDEFMAYDVACGPIFRRMKGFVSLRKHLSTDGTEQMGYWQWESRADHEACMQHEDWAPFAAKWEALQQSGKFRFELQTYNLKSELFPG